MTAPEDKIAKLPRWAREQIAALQISNKALTEQNASLRGQIPKSNTFYRLWDDKEFAAHYLPDNSYLTVIGKGTEVSIFVDSYEQIRIDIGHGLIMPQARNSIYIVSK